MPHGDLGRAVVHQAGCKQAGICTLSASPTTNAIRYAERIVPDKICILKANGQTRQ